MRFFTISVAAFALLAAPLEEPATANENFGNIEKAIGSVEATKVANRPGFSASSNEAKHAVRSSLIVSPWDPSESRSQENIYVVDARGGRKHPSCTTRRPRYDRKVGRHLSKIPVNFRNLNGLVRVKFGISGTGQLVDLKIAKSSGSKKADAAARRFLKKLEPFPKPAKGVCSNFVVPIQFQEAVCDVRQANYDRRVSRHLLSKSASNGGIRGTTRVKFSVADTGKVVGIEIAKSSGSRRVDRAAVQYLVSMEPFPKPPSGACASFVLPVRFAG